MRRIVARPSSVAPSRMALYLVHRPPARIRRHFVMVRRVGADRKRQSMAIHNRHDFHAFSALRSSDFQPAARHNEGCVDEAFFFVQRLYGKARWQHPSARDAKPHRGTKSESADAQFCSSGSSAAPVLRIRRTASSTQRVGARVDLFAAISQRRLPTGCRPGLKSSG